MLVVIAIIHIVCKHVKLKTSLTGIAFQPIKQTEAAVTSQIQQHCTAPVVCNCSNDPDDSSTYYLHLSNHTEMYYI